MKEKTFCFDNDLLVESADATLFRPRWDFDKNKNTGLTEQTCTDTRDCLRGLEKAYVHGTEPRCK